MGETIGAEVPAELKQRIDDYREPDESRSAAIERLIRQSLDETTDETLQTVNKTALLAGFVYTVLYYTADPTTAGAVGGLYIVFAVIWSSFPATVGRYLP